MIRPPYLKKGDTVALAAPARKIKQEEITVAIKVLESWGLRVFAEESLFKEFYQFGGEDEDRIRFFQSLLDNHEIKAIICARGGYGITRIIDQIDFAILSKQPKWICGYSDVTALLFHLYNHKVESIHSTMPLLFERDTPESLESLRKILFGESYEIKAPYHAFNKEGKSTGKVIGGNLSIINTLLCTASDVDTSGTILFIEDLDEYLYHIDRMIVHLKRAGKFQNLSGLIIGHMSDMKDNTIPFGSNAYEIISSWTKEYSFPVAFGFPIGHEPHNLAVPHGRTGKFTVTGNGSTLSFY